MLDLLHFMQIDGYLSSQELAALRSTSKELGESPVRLLRSLNIASPEQIQNFLQKHFKVLILNNKALENIGPDLQIYVPIDIALFYSCFGIGENNNQLYIAMEDPSDRGLIAQLRFLLGKKVVGVCATVYQVAEGITKIYDVPVSQLKLTTEIEKSRGVVGGVRFLKETQENKIKISEDFNGVGLSDEHTFDEVENVAEELHIETKAPLPVEETKPIINIDPKPIINIDPSPKHEPTFDFIDGSSGDIDPDLLKTDEHDQPQENQNQLEDPPVDDNLFSKNFSLNDEPALNENPQIDLNLNENNSLLEEDSNEDLKIELNENSKQKINTILNTLLTRLSMINKKEIALNTFNKLANSIECEIEQNTEDNNIFQFKGNSFSIKCTWDNLEEKNNSIYNSLLPALKKIARLK